MKSRQAEQKVAELKMPTVLICVDQGGFLWNEKIIVERPEKVEAKLSLEKLSEIESQVNVGNWAAGRK